MIRLIKVEPFLLDYQWSVQDLGVDGTDIFPNNAEEEELDTPQEEKADYQGG